MALLLECCTSSHTVVTEATDTLILIGFAIEALLLALIGIDGVISHDRTEDFGIFM